MTRRFSLLTLFAVTVILFSVSTGAASDKTTQLKTLPRTITKPEAKSALKVPSKIVQPIGDQDEDDTQGNGLPIDLVIIGVLNVTDMEDMENGTVPFEGECMCCFEQGYMMMRNVRAYVKNVGSGWAPDCVATLSWTDGQAPYQHMERQVDISNLSPDNAVPISVAFDPPVSFKTADTIRLVVDSTDIIDETDETNNTIEFDFEEFYEQRSYYFQCD